MSHQPGPAHPPKKRSWLPAQGTWQYHLLLGATAFFVLGPLGGVTAAYMNFSLGFFVGGQVLAGILGSAVTLGYGAEGKHGANYIQTMSASVAGLSGMAVLIQAMVWLGMPQPPVWQLMLYFLSIGLFGVGVGMLYTPVLVDRMRLMFPSGLAVANILRALTDKRLLQRSIGQLGSGAVVGFGSDMAAMHLKPLAALGVSGNIVTIGAGMIVGARITIPAVVVGAIGEALVPYLVEIGWLAAGEPFPKIFFIIALGTILGAAIVDLAIIFYGVLRRTGRSTDSAPQPALAGAERAPRNLTTRFVLGWTLLAGLALTVVASTVMQLPVGFVLFAIALVFLFVLINGVSLGISDSNPISSAFVLTVMLLAAIGGMLTGDADQSSPQLARSLGATLFLCAVIVLISCGVGCDMQQDRSTGWRLGSSRATQFWYQIIGLIMGAVMCVVFAQLFMTAFPELTVNKQDSAALAALSDEDRAKVDQWQAAMTYKFVGAINAVVDPKPHVMKALIIGIVIGLVTEALRKLLHAWRAYRAFIARGKAGFATGFVIDAFLLPTPYASSFGGFVDFATSLWFGIGGIVASYSETLEKQAAANGRNQARDVDLPADMSTNSLVGGGLIAGASLSALSYGIYKLLTEVL